MACTIPLELVQESLKYLCLNDQAAVSRSSCAFWNIATPFVWNEVHGVENIVQLLASASFPKREPPEDPITVSPCMIQHPLDSKRAWRFTFIAKWIRVLHVYPDQRSLYLWPTQVLCKIDAAVGSCFLPRLQHLSLSRGDAPEPCHEAYHWTMMFLHEGIRSIEFPALSQFAGLDLTYVDAWRLCTEIKTSQLQLTRLVIRCPYTDKGSPARIGLTHAVHAITAISTLTSLSITGSLFNKRSLGLLGGMRSLSSLEIVGGPLRDVDGTNLSHDAFPALTRLALRFFNDDETYGICSIPHLMGFLNELAIEWDSDTESESPGINVTIESIGQHCLRLQHLRLGLHDAVMQKTAHWLPRSIWRKLYSQTMQSVTLVGIVLGLSTGTHYHDALQVTWPKLKGLAVPCQRLMSNQLKLMKVKAPQIVHFVHWDSDYDEQCTIFCL